ncbi:PHD finger protein 7-like [Pithys albifrons albifrons]|uniref:PHD finger protein 7-like n=1 Tax=Pithys albifrons albifrons TaxID=3385563 RepID=UPI003A5CDFA0
MASAGLEVVAGEAGAIQPSRGWGPPLLSKPGPAGAGGTCWDTCAHNGPSSPRPPALSFIQAVTEQSQSSPWGQSHRDAVPSPAEVPFLVPLTLSLSACLLCKRSEADPDICGKKLERCGLCAHMFCLFFATLLHQQGNERVGFLGFLPKDILLAVHRLAQKRCFICGQSGATITCCEMECDLSFHLPCAKEAGCVTQYITPYSSYCPAHRPQQAVEATPEPGTQCLICMEPVEDRKTFKTMVCPECKSTWFHRDCIQGQALSAGILAFQCPLCRGHREFLMDMFNVGIRIPFRLPLWEEGNAFRDLGVRHHQCNARECLYPGGREEAEEEGPWEMLLCSSCAAEGTHKRCSSLTDSATSWECGSCAPLDTAPGNESELDIPDLGTQDSSSSTSPGPDLTQNGSCQQDPPIGSTSPHDRSRVRPSGIASRTRSQEETGTSRRQNCSRLQRQTPDRPGIVRGIPQAKPLPPTSKLRFIQPIQKAPPQKLPACTECWEAKPKGEHVGNIPQATPLPPAGSFLKSMQPVKTLPWFPKSTQPVKTLP